MADPSLIIDNRARLGATPGLHAILIGISDYVHLAGPDDPGGDGLHALKKLQSPALCARALAEKIKALDADDRLVRPLKTLRMLLAPSELEREVDPSIDAAGGCLPTRANIQQALEQWRDDVGAAEEEMALFHYAGHGLREMEDNILLASDFLAPGGNELDAAFKLSSIRNGMTVSDAHPKMGLDQFYFIDACREQAPVLEQLSMREPPAVFAPTLNQRTDRRRAPLYFATTNGGVSLSDAGEVSGFTKALIVAVDHAAPTSRWNEERQREEWPINATSLKNGIQFLDPDFKGEGKVELTGLISNPVLCFSLAPPRLTLRISFPQDKRASVARAVLKPFDGKAIRVPGRAADDPRTVPVTAGFYTVQVKPRDNAFKPLVTAPIYVSIDLAMPHAVRVP
jgi:hypothetical protein